MPVYVMQDTQTCCTECGVVVHNVDLHDGFHDRLHQLEVDLERLQVDRVWDYLS